MELFKYKHAPLLRDVNYLRIPVTIIPISHEGMLEFNEIYDYVRNIPDMHDIVFTKSGGISIANQVFRLPAYGIKKTRTVIELIILIQEGMWRIQFRTPPEKSDDNVLTGRKAFLKFKEICLSNGINLDDYKIDNGKEVKETIEKPLIKLSRPSNKDRIYTNVHHIDFHNSYPGGLCNAYPEFRPIIEPIYKARKTNPINKAILNYSIGFMQSIGGCGAKWSHLSKAAIEDNNKRINDISNRLTESGRIVLCYNTDGIWYQGDIYHGDGEGNNLGEWENDHINCTWRAKSDGCYEFIEDGKYYPVVRGSTRLDVILTRDKWKWGDIYQEDAEIIQYYFDKDKGVQIREEAN